MAARERRGKKAAAGDDTPEEIPEHPGQTRFPDDDVDRDEMVDGIEALDRLTKETRAIVGLLKITSDLDEQLHQLGRLAAVAEKVRARAAALQP